MVSSTLYPRVLASGGALRARGRGLARGRGCLSSGACGRDTSPKKTLRVYPRVLARGSALSSCARGLARGGWHLASGGARRAHGRDACWIWRLRGSIYVGARLVGWRWAGLFLKVPLGLFIRLCGCARPGGRASWAQGLQACIVYVCALLERASGPLVQNALRASVLVGLAARAAGQVNRHDGPLLTGAPRRGQPRQGWHRAPVGRTIRPRDGRVGGSDGCLQGSPLQKGRPRGAQLVVSVGRCRGGLCAGGRAGTRCTYYKGLTLWRRPRGARGSRQAGPRRRAAEERGAEAYEDIRVARAVVGAVAAQGLAEEGRQALQEVRRIADVDGKIVQGLVARLVPAQAERVSPACVRDVRGGGAPADIDVRLCVEVGGVEAPACRQEAPFSST